MGFAVLYLAAAFVYSMNLQAEAIHLDRPTINIGALEHDGVSFQSVEIERTKETPPEVTLNFSHAMLFCSRFELTGDKETVCKRKGFFGGCKEYFEPEFVKQCVEYRLDGNEENSVILDFQKVAGLSLGERERFSLNFHFGEPMQVNREGPKKRSLNPTVTVLESRVGYEFETDWNDVSDFEKGLIVFSLGQIRPKHNSDRFFKNYRIYFKGE